MPAYELAQLNIGIIKGPMDSPVMADFAAGLERINALADGSPGFVWRLQTAEGDATSIRPFEMGARGPSAERRRRDRQARDPASPRPDGGGIYLPPSVPASRCGSWAVLLVRRRMPGHVTTVKYS